MVSQNTGPKESQQGNEVAANQEVVLPSDGDSDSGSEIGEDNRVNEYMRIPLSPLSDDDEAFHLSTSEDEDSSGSQDNPIVPVAGASTSAHLPIEPVETSIVKQVWSLPPPKSVDIELNQIKVEEVKQAMVNITLPPEFFPEWAKNIPEEQWKAGLLRKLNNKDADK